MLTLHPSQVVAEAKHLELLCRTPQDIEPWPRGQWAKSGIVFDVLRSRLHKDGSVTVRIAPKYFETTMAG